MEDEILEQTGDAVVPANEEVIEEQPPASEIDEVTGEEKPIEPAFIPDYKFKANQQEMEIPEEFRPFIKDLDSQKKVKDIFEKYHGFDTQKTKLSSMEQDLGKYKGGYESLTGTVQDIQSSYKDAIESGNLHKLDVVWKKLGVSEDVVMAYAFEKAKLAEMDPQQRAIIEQKNRLEMDAFERKNYETSLMKKNQQKDLQIRQMHFDSAMATPQIQSFATELDSKFGNDGLFAQEVVNAGKTAYALEGKVLSVPEAINAVITKYGLKGQTQAAAAASTPAQGQKTAQGNVSADGKKIVQRETKVIPNVGSSGGASPVGAGKAKNIDDIRKRYAELAAQG